VCDHRAPFIREGGNAERDALGNCVGAARRLSRLSELVPGDVLAIEPGLWQHDIGEVRFEDLLLVTEDGCETLTKYPYDLSP